MKVSVVIPAYNEEKYIGRCLDSLMRQTAPPDEIIVVDNNSTDRTHKIASSYKNVTVIKETKQGVIPARNSGFNAARYEIIARGDADCIFPPDWIERIKYNYLNNPKLDAVSGTAHLHDFPLKNIRRVITDSHLLIKKLTGHYPLFGSNMSIKTSAWDQIKHDCCEDEQRIFEDIDISIHLHKVGGRIGFDRKLDAGISARRFKRNPAEIVIWYPYKILRTIRDHRDGSISSAL